MVVAESSGVARILLWEEDIGCLEANKSYLLAGMVVRSFGGEVYLSMSRKGLCCEAV